MDDYHLLRDALDNWCEEDDKTSQCERNHDVYLQERLQKSKLKVDPEFFAKNEIMESRAKNRTLRDLINSQNRLIEQA